jgi:hypothetical protein
MHAALITALEALRPFAIAKGFDWPEENMADSTAPVLADFLAEVSAFLASN